MINKAYTQETNNLSTCGASDVFPVGPELLHLNKYFFYFKLIFVLFLFILNIYLLFYSDESLNDSSLQQDDILELTKDININANKNKELIDEVNSILDVPSLDSSNNPTNNFQKQDEIITPSLQLEESKDIKKSNIFNFDNFDEWFNNLDVVKQLSFSLLLTHGVVISALTNIIFVYYGNILIDKFNLETRYPKLKKIIEYRNKFSQFYFLNSCFIILIVSVTYISFAIVQLSS